MQGCRQSVRRCRSHTDTATTTNAPPWSIAWAIWNRRGSPPARNRSSACDGTRSGAALPRNLLAQPVGLLPLVARLGQRSARTYMGQYVQIPIARTEKRLADFFSEPKSSLCSGLFMNVDSGRERSRSLGPEEWMNADGAADVVQERRGCGVTAVVFQQARESGTAPNCRRRGGELGVGEDQPGACSSAMQWTTSSKRACPGHPLAM